MPQMVALQVLKIKQINNRVADKTAWSCFEQAAGLHAG